jgi:hypothetical protein
MSVTNIPTRTSSDANAAADINTLNTNDQSLQTELTTADGNISTLQTDVGTLQTDVGTLQTDVGTLQTDVGTLQTGRDVRDALSVTITTADVTLTTTQCLQKTIILSGTLTGNRNLILPTNSREYKIICNCTGAYYIIVKTSAQTGGVYFAPGDIVDVYCNGTNVLLLKLTSHTYTSIGVTGTPTTSWVQLALGSPTGDVLSEISGNAITVKNSGRMLITFAGGDAGTVGGTLSVSIYKNGSSYMSIARDTAAAGNAYVGAVGTLNLPVTTGEVYTIWAQSTLGAMSITGNITYQRT